MRVFDEVGLDEIEQPDIAAVKVMLTNAVIMIFLDVFILKYSLVFRRCTYPNPNYHFSQLKYSHFFDNASNYDI